MNDNHTPTIALDFDGVINTYSGWEGEDELYEPRPGIEHFLKRLKQMDFEIAVYSTRGTDSIAEWMHEHELLGLVDEVTEGEKPPAVAYIDDRAVRFCGSFDSVIHRLKHGGLEAHWENDSQHALMLDDNEMAMILSAVQQTINNTETIQQALGKFYAPEAKSDITPQDVHHIAKQYFGDSEYTRQDLMQAVDDELNRLHSLNSTLQTQSEINF